MARASTPQQRTLNLRCHEYCDGSQAVFYCPQCSAIFCDSCYDREHQGSVRKQTHERLVEVRPICREHQHTLEYFDLTSLKAICITCLTHLQSKGELQNHVIEKIDDVSSKLCSLLNEKVMESKAVLKSVQKAARRTSEMTKKTINRAKLDICDYIDYGYRMLKEKEQRINRQMKKVYNDFLNSEDSTAGLVGLASRLQDNIQQAERLSDEANSVSTQFPYLFNKLTDLCEMARKHLDNPKRLRVTVSFSKVAADKILSMVDVEAEVLTADELSDDEEEVANRSNCSSCSSPAYITTNLIQTIAGVDRLDMAGHQSQNKQAESIMDISPVLSKSGKSCIHGNRSKELESPGNHSNDSEEIESPDTYHKQEKESDSNQTDGVKSPDHYGNLQEDLESSSNRSNQTDDVESPDLYGNQQQEDLESSHSHSSHSEEFESLSNQSEEIKSPDRDTKQEEVVENPGSRLESPDLDGSLFESIQSHRIHGNSTPKNRSNHDNQDEDSDEAVPSRMNEKSRDHSNHHVTKKVVIRPSGSAVRARSKTTPRKRKRGTKRKRLLSEDREWTPTRILRPSTMERRKSGTVPQSRSRRGGELSQELNRCDAILTILWADENSWPFMHLIDKKRCPEYYEKISNPVSLDIMKQRLHSYQYRSVLDFVRDFNQIIENCHVFNKAGSEVSEAGTRLAHTFNRLLRQCFPNIENVFDHPQLMDSSL